MPKLTSKPPRLCKRNDRGTAYVYLNGKKMPMGRIGDEANRNYEKFKLEWFANRLSTLEISFSSERVGASLGRSKQKTSDAILLDELFARYLEWFAAQPNYSASDFNNYKNAIKRMRTLFPGLTVGEIGAKELELFRTSMIQSGFVKRRKISIGDKTTFVEERCDYSRQFLNKTVNFVRTIFSWGGSQGLVSPETFGNLKFVRPLKAGRTSAPESKPREIIHLSDFNKTLPLLLSIYRNFVTLLKLTAMRPSELCRMKKQDVDQDSYNDIWLYRPGFHKTLHRNKVRTIPLGKRAQAILAPILAKKQADEFVFSPKDAIDEYHTEINLRRKSKIPPSQIERSRRNAQAKYKRLKDYFEPITIQRQIRKKIKQANENGANIKPWTLYQLRHTAVSEIALKEGEIAAQRLAGHASLNTTEIYNHSAILEAISVAKKYG